MTDDILTFVGTYTDAGAEGIFTRSLDGETGSLERVGGVDAGPRTSFLAVHPSGEYLYAVNEVETGAVTALSIDRETGELTVLDRVETGGGAYPCHCSTDATGQYLLVAHYSGGTVAMVPIGADGGVGEPTDLVAHEGSGPNADRQSGPHPHSIQPGPDNRYAYAPDLGTDEVVAYEMDLAAGTLTRDEAATASLHPGAGPRHLDFHPNGRDAYLLNELDSTLAALERDPDTGALSVNHVVSTLPDDFAGENTTADVHVHDSGRWVYASNRGHDSVTVFAIDPSTGEPTVVERTATGGEWPRNFAITPPGTHLLAANKDTDDIVSFAIDAQDGTLAATGDRAEVPSPVCVRFLD